MRPKSVQMLDMDYDEFVELIPDITTNNLRMLYEALDKKVEGIEASVAMHKSAGEDPPAKLLSALAWTIRKQAAILAEMAVRNADEPTPESKEE